jgi:hypothetical protein
MVNANQESFLEKHGCFRGRADRAEKNQPDAPCSGHWAELLFLKYTQDATFLSAKKFALWVLSATIAYP